MRVDMSKAWVDIELCLAYMNCLEDLKVILNEDVETICAISIYEAIALSEAFEQSLPRLLNIGVYSQQEGTETVQLNLDLIALMENRIHMEVQPLERRHFLLPVQTVDHISRNALNVLHSWNLLTYERQLADISKTHIGEKSKLSADKVVGALEELYIKGIIRIERCALQVSKVIQLGR